MTSVVVTLDTTTLNTITYSYIEGYGTVTCGNTSNRLLTLTQVFDGVTHTETLEYDDQGFITKITNQSGQVIEYYYDNKGQLRRENNQIDSYTHIFNYDDYGNITSQYYYSFNQGDGSLSTPGAVEWYQYQYTWKDQISQSGWSYPYNPSDNYTIDYTYDGAGNLISMDDSRGSSYDQSYTWEGRSLLTYTDGSTSASYTYNQNGIRDSKTVNGVTTTYYLDGTKVLYESDGINNIYYTYDVDGTLISMNYNGSEYYYVFNALGDVTHLFDSSGDVVVEYRYDSYGNLDDSITLSGVGLANPYRYRSYRFDNETGYYYLQSRYYNPETGRFINADGIIRSSETTLGHNMYSYVNNNPIMLVDVNGYLPKWAKITIAVAAGVATGLLTGNVVAGICVGATVLSGLDYLDERALRDNQLEELERDLESIDNENIREAYRESATKAIEYRHGFAYAEWFPGFFTNPIDAAGSILGLNINIVGIIGDLAYDVYEDESMWLTPFTNGDITQEEIDEYRQDIREKYLRD